MKEEPKTKCSEAEFIHSWSDITPNIIYPTNPPRYPNRQEQCVNCGLIRTYHSKQETWFEYTQGELQNYNDITITGDLIGGSGTTTTFVDSIKISG